MANQEHVEILRQGKDAWNEWRKQYPDIEPDLSESYYDDAKYIEFNFSNTNFYGSHLFRANFYGASLRGADLSYAALSHAHLATADLSEARLYRTRLENANFFNARLNFAHLSFANLNEASLYGASLREADLTSANLSDVNLTKAHLTSAHLANANLYGADLSDTDLSGADLSNANLIGTRLVRTNLTDANLSNCRIYGISAWDVQLEGANQVSLIITLINQPTITVDNLKVAQFIYLLLNNKEIRNVIDTITSKVVLILGRFTDERKKVLDAIRDELRKRNYTPVLFDFEKPASRDITETVSTLAHMARFVIADITDAKSIPQELKTIVPNLPSVPVQPLILNSQYEYGMFEHFTRFPWVLPLYRYADEVNLLQSLKETVIDPAERKAKELEKR